MNGDWVRVWNRIFDVINERNECYFSGSRFIDKVREIDPYFPTYGQFIEERQRTGQATYALRPPVAQDRLRRAADGQV